MIIQRLACISAILGQILLGCGKSSNDKDSGGGNDGGPGGGPQGAVGSLALNITIANTQPAASLRLTNDTSDRFESTSIVSGPPEEMEIYIQKITLSSNDAGVEVMNIFEDTAGKAVRIKGSKVDLSSLFTNFDCRTPDGQGVDLNEGETCECGLDSNGKLVGKIESPIYDEEGVDTGEKQLVCDIDKLTTPPIPLVQAKAATYHNLSVTYSLGAKMKGCVSGYFRESNTAAAANELVTYCTKANGSYFDKTTEHRAAHFVGSSTEENSPEWTMVPISRLSDKHAGGAKDQLNISYPIGGGLDLAAGGKADLTFLIDTNRMLRFSNGGRADDSPPDGTEWTKERAYFFNAVFPDSTFMFAGEAGEIKGYQWNARSCRTEDDLRTDDDYQCPAWMNVQGWLTIIEDSDEKPFLMSFMPDDDATLTVIKGSNAPVTRGDRTPGSNFNSAAFVDKGNNLFDLQFALDAKMGEIKDFPYDLELNQTSASLKFEALTEKAILSEGEDFGRIIFSRKL
jgi:hypothetical protein